MSDAPLDFEFKPRLPRVFAALPACLPNIVSLSMKKIFFYYKIPLLCEIVFFMVDLWRLACKSFIIA